MFLGHCFRVAIEVMDHCRFLIGLETGIQFSDHTEKKRFDPSRHSKWPHLCWAHTMADNNKQMDIYEEVNI